MKTKLRLSKLIMLLFVVLGTVAFISCEETFVDKFDQEDEIVLKSERQENPSLNTIPEIPSDCGTPVVNILYAGQHINVGNVTIENDENYLYITYNTENDWVLKCTHLYVGSYDDAPLTNNGSPKIGHFPYHECFDPYETSYTFQIPLDELDECFIIAAHAEVVLLNEEGEPIQEETAWGDGERFRERGSWAMYMEYCEQECDTPCEIKRKDFKFFAKETILIGEIRVINDEENLEVVYFVSRGDTYMSAAHLYVGTLEGMPIDEYNAPVPEEFPNKMEFDPLEKVYKFTVPLEGLPECYIIAAHAIVHKVEEGEIVATEEAWSYGEPFPDTEQWGWYTPYCTQICD